MTILEEVIMYTFQQCVYYITKVVCHSCQGAVQFMSSKHTHTQKLRLSSVLPFYCHIYVMFCLCASVLCTCVSGSVRGAARSAGL